MKQKCKKSGNKRKSGPKRSGPKSPSKIISHSPSESNTEMNFEFPNSNEGVAEKPVIPTVVSGINEENETKVENKFSENLVTQDKVEEPEESAVVDENLIEKIKTEENQMNEEEKNEEGVVDGEDEKEFDEDEEQYEDECEIDEDDEEEENVDGKIVDDARCRKISLQSGVSSKTGNHSEKSSLVEHEPEVFTNYDWEKKDDDYNIEQAVFVKSYSRKFVAILHVIDPEFRFVAGVGPCDTYDLEGVQKLLTKIKEAGCENPWPFDESFKATSEELRLFLTEVLNRTKFCLRLACAERGYEYKGGKLTTEPISCVWGNVIEPMAELKTIKAIFFEMKESLMRSSTEGKEARFWAESDKIFEIIIPALESFDSKTLSENSVSDCMATIHGRKELGFEIKEEEVDKMLEQSFSEDGFGEFPPTALYAPSVFTTVKHLKLIFAQLEKMSKVTDIRVKLAGIQTITRVLELIDQEESMSVLEELRDQLKIPIEKMFGFNPMTFEINKNDPKRVQYLKMFYTTLGENNPKEDFCFPLERLVAALKCFYLVFSAFEVNMVIFKIIGTRMPKHDRCKPASVSLDRDRNLLLDAMLLLPEQLKKWLEIGAEYTTGEVTENTESMYYQAKNLFKCGYKEVSVNILSTFLGCTTRCDSHIISSEKVMRMAMKCVETGTNQAMAVETLKILHHYHIKRHEFSKEFFEDLLLLALSKYSVPDVNTSEKKYKFIDEVFNILQSFKNEQRLEIDETKIVEKWANMGHPWFSVLYLAHKFPLLKFSTPVTQYPWLSTDVWSEDKKDPTDFKAYIILAKVPTAWPDSNDLEIITTLVAEHVPNDVNRIQLYNGMKDYVSDFTINDGWKKSLLKALDNKIKFLAPLPKRARKDKNCEKGNRKTDEKSSNNDDKSVKDPAEIVDKVVEKVVEDKEEKAMEDDKESNKESKKNELTIPEKTDSSMDNVETISASHDEPTEKNVKKHEEVQNANTENSEKDLNPKSKIEDIKNGVNNLEDDVKIELKSLSALDEHCFYAFYPEDQWNNLENRIKIEICRQRKKNGYSNKV